jgi:hypothetical protein
MMMNKKRNLTTFLAVIGLLVLSSIAATVKAHSPVAPDPTPLTTPMASVMLMTDEQFVYGPDLYDPLRDGFFYDVSDFTRRDAPALRTAKLQPAADGLTTADEVIDFHAHFYSVNPKLLLTLMEVLGDAWNDPDKARLPFGSDSISGDDLYRQSDWLAQSLATHFYAYRQGHNDPIILDNQARFWLPANAGSYAIAKTVMQLAPASRWESILAKDGELVSLYRRFFGPTPSQPTRPLVVTTEPVWSLPFVVEGAWYFTGGPHAYDGEVTNPWSSVDLQPQDIAGTCNVSNDPTRSVADGTVTYAAGNWIVIDHGGGWQSTYYHQEIDVTVGTVVNRGDPISRSSCAGCPGCGSHVHLNTRLNGVFQAIDSKSFNCWVVHQGATQYAGSMTRDGVTRNRWELIDNNGCLTGVDTTPPSVSITQQPTIGAWYNTDQTIAWTISDSESGVRGHKLAWDQNPPGGSEIASASGSANLSSAGQGQHTLYIQAWDNAVNPSAVVPVGWLGYDTVAPANPTFTSPGCTVTNGVWQNTCADANFTWSGASDATSSAAGYEVYWGTDPNGTGALWSTTAAYNPPAVGNGTYYLRVHTKDNAGNWSAWTTLFVLRYDGAAPTGSLIINSGSATTHATLVKLSPSAADGVSGICQMRLRDAGGTWSSWQGYTTSAYWQLPGPTGQTFQVEAQFADCAGNQSDIYAYSIALNIYPARPASANYRVVKSTLGASGQSGASTNYRLNATLGQPSMIGQMDSTNYGLASGYWALRCIQYAVYLPLIRR